jgi:hypothetical protein
MGEEGTFVPQHAWLGDVCVAHLGDIQWRATVGALPALVRRYAPAALSDGNTFPVMR